MWRMHVTNACHECVYEFKNGCLNESLQIPGENKMKSKPNLLFSVAYSHFTSSSQIEIDCWRSNWGLPTQEIIFGYHDFVSFEKR